MRRASLIRGFIFGLSAIVCGISVRRSIEMNLFHDLDLQNRYAGNLKHDNLSTLIVKFCNH